MRLRFRQLHMVLGLTIGLVVSAVGLTGSILAFDQEIDAALHPALYAVRPEERTLDLPRLDAELRRLAPADAPVVRLAFPTRDGDPVVATLRGGHQLHLAPNGTRVLGEREASEHPTVWVEDLHRTLFLGEAGTQIVAWSALLLCLTLLSGLLLGLPKRAWPQLKPFHWGRFNREGHHVLGVYALPLVVVLALTGAALSFSWHAVRVYSFLTASPLVVAHFPESAPGPRPTLPLATLYERAQSRFPGAAITQLTYPRKATATYCFYLRPAGDPHPQGRSFVYLDAGTGAVLHTMDGGAQPLGWRLFYMVNGPLHTGRLFGWVQQVLWALAGLAPLLLSLSGLTLFLKRRQAIKRGREARELRAKVAADKQAAKSEADTAR